MSRENVDVLLRGIAFANAGDVEAGADLYHPEAELRDLQHPPDMPDGVSAARSAARTR